MLPLTVPDKEYCPRCGWTDGTNALSERPAPGNKHGGNGDGDENNKQRNRKQKMADGNIPRISVLISLKKRLTMWFFQTNEFPDWCDFYRLAGTNWQWILQMCMALAALFAIVMAAGMAYKMMVKHEPLDVLNCSVLWLFQSSSVGGIRQRHGIWLAIGAVAFSWLPSYIPTASARTLIRPAGQPNSGQIRGSYSNLSHVRDTMYQSLQAQADVAHTGTPPTRTLGRNDHGTNRSGMKWRRWEKDPAELVYLTDGRSHHRYRQNHHAYRSDCVSYRMVGDHLLPAKPTGHVNTSGPNGRSRCCPNGKVHGRSGFKVSDSTFLWCNALLCRLLYCYCYSDIVLYAG